MKVFAINSSPRGEGQSKTELMLNSLLEGMRDAGADVEVVALREKKIKNCIGCFTCWTKSPGLCIHKDDMTNGLLEKWQQSDIAVYATPLYNYTMTALLKTFLERTLPSVLPFFEIHEGRMFHPLRGPRPAMVVLSVSGMPDESHFSALSAHVRYLCSSPGGRLLAEIYRPAAEVMTRPFLKRRMDDVLDATKQAGRELIQSMEVSPGTLARITQPLLDPETFASMVNLVWKTCIAEKVSTGEFTERRMVPRPASLDDFMLLFPFGLSLSEVGDEKVVVQFTFSGEVEEPCYFTIEKGKMDAKRGVSESPGLIIDSPFNVWMDIMTGKADGRQMLMEQKYRVKGDLSLMMRLFQPG